MIDPRIKEFATPRQKQIIEVYERCGSSRRAAEILGINRSTVSRAVEAATRAMKKTGAEIGIEEEHRLQKACKELRQENQRLKEVIATDKTVGRVLQALDAHSRHIKPLSIKRPSKKKPPVAATAFLSDTHWDEVVNPAEVDYINIYNRDIAARRLSRFAEKTVLMAHNYMAEFDVVALDLPLGGDMVSGNIHEELARSNADEIMGTVVHWSERLAEVIVALSKEFKKVRCPAVVGNHGRNTKKPRHKGRVRDNFDWLIYQWAASLVNAAGCNNVEFQIASGTDILWETFGTRYLMTHGDQASGGSGWGGIMSPIMRLDDKKRKRQAAVGRPYDILIMGHWHQFKDLGNVIINGTCKGYDEFSANNNFAPEPPQQAFWLTDPQHGKILSAPLLVADGEDMAAADAA